MARSTKDAEGTTAATGTRTTKHGVSRLLVYAPAWVVWLLWLPLAAIVYRIWGDDYTARPWLSLGIFVASIGAAGITWRYGAHRGELLRLLATGTTVLAGLWLLVAAIVGPLTRPIPDLWGGVGAAICVYWTIRRALMGTGDQVVAATGPAAKLVEALKGARVGNPRVLDGGVVETGLEVERGSQTLADVQQQLPVMTAAVGMRPGSMRLVPDSDDAGAGTLVAVPVDPLAETIPWPGPSAPGESVHIGAPVGTYDVGRIARIYLSGDDATGRALVHWLIMGMSGAGKSSAMKLLIGDIVTRRDVTIWAHDHVKGLQTLSPLLGGLDWVTFDLKAGKTMLAEVRRGIQVRTDYLGRRNLEQWESDCGLNLLVVWIEEATELADLEALLALVREARSVGIIIMISLQRASHGSMDTDVRAQLGGAWCFGVRDSADTNMALPDAAIDAGATPELWGADKPGASYLCGPGIPRELWAAEIRTWRATAHQLKDACELGKRFRQPLDLVTTAGLGAAYHQRPAPISYLDQADAGPVDQPQSGIAIAPAAVTGELVDDDRLDSERIDDMPSDYDPDIEVNPDAPVGQPPVNMRLGAPRTGPKLSTDDARAVVQRHLATLHAAGKGYTQPADIAAMKPPTTRTSEWVRLELHRLASDAQPGEWALDRDPSDQPGMFRIVEPAHTAQRELAPAGV